MTVEAIGTMAQALVRALEDRAAAYHVKSDLHEILLWEAAIVAARARQLAEGDALPAALRDSLLDGTWRHDLHQREQDLVARVRAFHAAIDALP